MTMLIVPPDANTQIRSLRNEAAIAQLALEQLTTTAQAGLHSAAGADLLYRLGAETSVGEPTITSLLGELVNALTPCLRSSGQPGGTVAAEHLSAAAASLRTAATHIERALNAVTARQDVAGT